MLMVFSSVMARSDPMGFFFGVAAARSQWFTPLRWLTRSLWFTFGVQLLLSAKRSVSVDFSQKMARSEPMVFSQQSALLTAHGLL